MKIFLPKVDVRSYTALDTLLFTCLLFNELFNKVNWKSNSLENNKMLMKIGFTPQLFVEVNGTKIALTGIPQIDYVWDPNLPRELNG